MDSRHQVRKDAPGNIHVGLDSSTPCWNDAIEETLLEVTEVPLPRIFLKECSMSLRSPAEGLAALGRNAAYPGSAPVAVEAFR